LCWALSQQQLSSTLQFKPRTIRGAPFTAVEGLAAVQTVVSQHFNNAWIPRAGWAASANRTHSISLRRDHIHQLGIDKAILIEMH
jgi:hypothetical protein